jgi:hypothetical protein
MAVRSGAPIKSVATQFEELSKTLNRIYLFWIAGLSIGVLGLQRSSLSMAGLSINIAHPETIQGILYAIVLYRTFFFINDASRLLTNRAWLRLSIYGALSKGRRSLRDYSAARRPALHAHVRGVSWVLRGLFMLYAAIPSISILILSRDPLGATFAALSK